VEIVVTSEQVAEGVSVHVAVRLSPRETNRLFLSGDTLVLLPTEGLVGEAGAPIPRSSIFLSELAGSRSGLDRVFADARAAEQYATAVRGQLETILEEL
jgi:hypothetical protein